MAYFDLNKNTLKSISNNKLPKIFTVSHIGKANKTKKLV